jgi:hypothetical protein
MEGKMCFRNDSFRRLIRPNLKRPELENFTTHVGVFITTVPILIKVFITELLVTTSPQSLAGASRRAFW